MFFFRKGGVMASIDKSGDRRKTMPITKAEGGGDKWVAVSDKQFIPTRMSFPPTHRV